MAFSLQTLVFVTCLVGGCFGVIEIIQDGNFILEYNLLPNETLSVTATAKGLGWVGVGLSESGDMILADLILGGVANGKAYSGDYFGYENSRPIEDIENNILTFSATENATHTVFHFTRLADTGDELEDIPVDQATHIIWAYSADSDDLEHHGIVNRGNISLTTK